MPLVECDSSIWNWLEKGMIIGFKMSINRMYAIMADVISPFFQSNYDDVTHLWHCIYGPSDDLSFVLKVLVQNSMVKGFIGLKESSNVHTKCMIGNQHKKPFLESTSWRTTQCMWNNKEVESLA